MEAGYKLVKKYLRNPRYCENAVIGFEQTQIAIRWIIYIKKLYCETPMDEAVIETEQEAEEKKKGKPIMRSQLDEAIKKMEE